MHGHYSSQGGDGDKLQDVEEVSESDEMLECKPQSPVSCGDNGHRQGWPPFQSPRCLPVEGSSICRLKMMIKCLLLLNVAFVVFLVYLFI